MHQATLVEQLEIVYAVNRLRCSRALAVDAKTRRNQRAHPLRAARTAPSAIITATARPSRVFSVDPRPQAVSVHSGDSR